MPKKKRPGRRPGNQGVPSTVIANTLVTVPPVQNNQEQTWTDLIATKASDSYSYVATKASDSYSFATTKASDLLGWGKSWLATPTPDETPIKDGLKEQIVNYLNESKRTLTELNKHLKGAVIESVDVQYCQGILNNKPLVSSTSEEIKEFRELLSIVMKPLVAAAADDYLDTLDNLKTGGKQYLTLVTEIEDDTRVIHIHISDLLKEEESIVQEILDSFVKQGAVKELHAVFTSNEEALALSTVLNKVKMTTLIQDLNTSLQEIENNILSIKGLDDLVTFIRSNASDDNNLAYMLKLSQDAFVLEKNKILEELQCRPQFNFDLKLIDTLAHKKGLFVLTSEKINTALKDNIGSLGEYAKLGDKVEKIFLPKITVRDSSLLLSSNQAATEWFKGNLPAIAAQTGHPKLKALSKPQVVPEAPKPQVIPEAPKPQVIPEVAKPQVIPEVSKPQVVPAVSKPQVVPAVAKLQVVPEVPKPQVVLEVPKPQDPPQESKPQDITINSAFSKLSQRSPKLNEDLSTKEEEYTVLLNDFKVIVEELELRKIKNEKYIKVAAAANIVHEKLTLAGEQFFKTPTSANFKLFKDECTEIFKEAEPEFKEHRSLWYQMDDIFRKIFGVLALISVIPALVVAGSNSTHGFYNTFFGPKPHTKSEEHLGKLALDIVDKQSEIYYTLANSGMKMG